VTAVPSWNPGALRLKLADIVAQIPCLGELRSIFV
jgi:hypothetical protein